MIAKVSLAREAHPAATAYRSQRRALVAMLLAYALGTALYIVIPGGMLDPRAAQAVGMPPTPAQIPVWQLVLANVGMVLVGYGLLGLAGLWLSRQVGLPGIYRPQAGMRRLFLRPLSLGLLVGLALLAGDLAARRFLSFPGFAHPVFPASILASLCAGIGEEILTRLVVFSLWALILTWLFERLFPGRSARRAVMWIANVIAALTFAASHLPGFMFLAGVSSPAALPPTTLAGIFLLNGLMGIVAGELCLRDGLIAAFGVHFWGDVVWHVLYGLLRTA